MRNKFVITLVVLSFLVSGCAKKDESLSAPSGSKIETPATGAKTPIYLRQGAQTNNEKIPWIYIIDPDKKTIEMEWVEWIEIEKDGWIEAEQTSRVHATDLLTFNQSDEAVVFSYLDEDGIEVEKTFEILSDSVVKDEQNQRYEW